jgi:hypothetical protein
VDRTLEVRREPAPSPSAPCGWDHDRVRVLRAGDTVRPIAAGEASIAVADLRPPV